MNMFSELITYFYFTYDEKVKFLENKKYIIKKVKVQIAIPLYHNDVEYSDKEVIGVFESDGETPYEKPTYYDNDYWLNSVFYSELKRQLLKL